MLSNNVSWFVIVVTLEVTTKILVYIETCIITILLVYGWSMGVVLPATILISYQTSIHETTEITCVLINPVLGVACMVSGAMAASSEQI